MKKVVGIVPPRNIRGVVCDHPLVQRGQRNLASLLVVAPSGRTVPMPTPPVMEACVSKWLEFRRSHRKTERILGKGSGRHCGLEHEAAGCWDSNCC